MSPAYQEIKRPRGGQRVGINANVSVMQMWHIFAPDLLLSFHIFATYLQSRKKQICSNPFFFVQGMKLNCSYILFLSGMLTWNKVSAQCQGTAAYSLLPVGGSYTNENPLKHISTSFKVKGNK